LNGFMFMEEMRCVSKCPYSIIKYLDTGTGGMYGKSTFRASRGRQSESICESCDA
jgi:hypothetical protein